MASETREPTVIDVIDQLASAPALSAHDINTSIDQLLAFARETRAAQSNEQNKDSGDNNDRHVDSIADKQSTDERNVIPVYKRPADEQAPRVQNKRPRWHNSHDKTPLQILHEMFAGLCNIRFEEVMTEGPSHDPVFKISVHLKGEVFHGEGKNKQAAKQVAARKAVAFFVQREQHRIGPPNPCATDQAGFDNRLPKVRRGARYFEGPAGSRGPSQRGHWPDFFPGPGSNFAPPPHYGRPPPRGFGPQGDFCGPPDEFYGPPGNFGDAPVGPPLPWGGPMGPLRHPANFPPRSPPRSHDYPPGYISFESSPVTSPIVPPPLVSCKPAQVKTPAFTEDNLEQFDEFVDFNQDFEMDNSNSKSQDSGEKEEDFQRKPNSKTEKIRLRVTTDGAESENLVHEHPVSLIHELHPDLAWFFVGRSGTSKNAENFKMSLRINSKNYLGEGRTKKLARFAAAKSALSELYNIVIPEHLGTTSKPNEKPATKNVLIKVDDTQLLNETLATRIGMAVLQRSKEVFDALDTTKKWNVLAGIVLTREDNPSYMDIVCVTSGTKCIKGDNLSMIGVSIHDCHAEVLARRCFINIMYNQIAALVNNGFMDDGNFLIERREDGFGFRLKREIKVHLFISSAPCGDCRVFSPKDEEQAIPDAHPNRISRGLLRAKIEGGEGTIPVKRDASMLTWDGVAQGQQRLQFMSCSDKVAMWNVVGIQGSLLSHFIEPIYLESVVLGSLFNYEHLLRGIYSRLNLNFESHSLSGLPPCYRVNKIKIAKAKLPAADIQRQLTKTPGYAINWIAGDEKAEVISCDSGKVHEENSISRLTKRALFQQFRNLLGQNTPTLPSSTLHNNIPLIYRDGKTAAMDFSRAKVQAVQAFEEQNLGHWIQLPSEFDLFSL